MSVNPTMMKTHEFHKQSVHASEYLTESHSVAAHSGASTRSLEYRVTYALVFMVCFAITGLCRLLPRNRHPWICSGDDGSASLWSEARSAADSTVPYIFQQ